MTRPQRRAVVIGASMAGLCVASALAEHFPEVTVIDRDRLPDGVAARSGVPQGRHIHLLLAAGAEALGTLFPGLIKQLVADGAALVPVDRARLCFGGHPLARAQVGDERFGALGASRPLLEARVRERVRALPETQVLDGVEARGLLTNADGSRVVGVAVSGRDGSEGERTLAADLVVDCSGRRSSTPQWLREAGVAQPPVERLEVEVRYASRHYRLPPGATNDDGIITVGPTPDGARGGVLLANEGDRWVVTLFGMCGTRPPHETEAFERFAAELSLPDLGEILAEGEPIDDVAAYRFPANLRRRYERAERLPAGLLVAGDAVCSFNPIYGQGMTIAALEAVALRRLLDEGGVPGPDRWFAAISETIDPAWAMAVGADLSLDCVDGDRSVADRLQGAYVRRLQAAARHDAVLAGQYLDVISLLAPPQSLLRPAMVARVARGSLRRGPSRPGRR